MSELREQILAIVSKACFSSDDPCDVCVQRADAVMAVVQSEIDAKDAEIRRLRRKVEREQIVAKMAEQHAEQAEARRDQFRSAWRCARIRAKGWRMTADRYRERGQSDEQSRDTEIAGLDATIARVTVLADDLDELAGPDRDWSVRAKDAAAGIRAALAQPDDQEGTTP